MPVEYDPVNRRGKRVIRLAIARKEDETKLYNLLQKYLYDMSRYYDTPMDENGNYAYPYLRYYFEEPRRKAYFIYDDGALVGFAMVNAHSFAKPEAENCLAEFTIFPGFRSRGYGLAAMRELFRIRPGTWQLKYSPVNAPGMAFWKKLTAPYGATETRLDGGEVVLSFSV